MTSRERTLWEQAVRVLKQNTVTTKVPAANRVSAGDREQADRRGQR